MQRLDQARASSSSFLLNATATSPVNSPSPRHISAGRPSGAPFPPQRQRRAPIFFSALPPAQRHVATYVSQKSLPLVLSTNSLFPAACLTPHITPAVRGHPGAGTAWYHKAATTQRRTGMLIHPSLPLPYSVMIQYYDMYITAAPQYIHC